MGIYYDSITWFASLRTVPSVALVLLMLSMGIAVFRGNSTVRGQSTLGSRAPAVPSLLPLGTVTLRNQVHVSPSG
jgi:hypothetical protein